MTPAAPLRNGTLTVFSSGLPVCGSFAPVVTAATVPSAATVRTGISCPLPPEELMTPNWMPCRGSRSSTASGMLSKMTSSTAGASRSMRSSASCLPLRKPTASSAGHPETARARSRKPAGVAAEPVTGSCSHWPRSASSTAARISSRRDSMTVRSRVPKVPAESAPSTITSVQLRSRWKKRIVSGRSRPSSGIRYSKGMPRSSRSCASHSTTWRSGVGSGSAALQAKAPGRSASSGCASWSTISSLMVMRIRGLPGRCRCRDRCRCRGRSGVRPGASGRGR